MIWRNFATRVAVCLGLLLTLALWFSSANHSLAQRRQPALACKQQVLAALKPKPELVYECGDLPNDWDEKILELPARREAIKTLTSQLTSLADDAWWTADTVDLNVCDFTHEPGVLTADQRHDFVNGEYLYWLFGNNRFRLVLVPDPCYQTQYGGSNAFLLYRIGGKVFVGQVLDGYFSRADNSVGLAFARINNEEIIEVSTGTGGLNPTVTNYYFVIDLRTNQLLPKKLFQGSGGLTNQISSALLLNGGSEPLQIIRRNTLAPTFIVYRDNGSRVSRKILRWNGKLYR